MAVPKGKISKARKHSRRANWKLELPGIGEILSLMIVKEGKEASQGVGYLPDGTMVVVDGAREKVGETVRVQVSSVLQTNAGRMIFARMAVDQSV